MRTIKKQICREELISRLPALFAYMEADETGAFHLHKSTDALQGCWGKIVSNIKMFSNLPYLAEFYIVNGETLIHNAEYVALTDEEKKGKTYSLYQSKVYEKNDLSKIITQKEYDGKEDKEKLNYHEIVNVMVDGGKTYSYRTLMNFYYKYKGEYSQQPLFSFIDRYIGLVDVPVQQTEETDLMPNKVYLADLRRLLPIYQRYDVIYQKYSNEYVDYSKQKNLDHSICCAIKTYMRMGGEDMYAFLKGLFDEMNIRVDEAFEMAVGEAQLSILINMNQSQNDLGYLSCYLNEWLPGEFHKKGELCTYDGNTYISNVDNWDWFDERTGELVFFKPDYKEGDEHFTKVSETDNVKDVISAKYPNGRKKKLESFTISSKSDSKLNGLRRYTKYINEAGESEEEPDGENWLYFFRTNLVMNISVITDDDGNIADIVEYKSSGNRIKATEPDKLAAYGDVIHSITRDAKNRTITFEYYIGAHLTAEKKGSTNTSPIIWTNFAYKDGGVKYTETYSYEEGGEIDKMDEYDVDFDEYVKGENANDYRFDFHKYAFGINGNMSRTEVYTHRGNLTWDYISTDSEVTDNGDVDYMYADIIKENYLTGITYKPEVESSVFIDRGNYSAFERHIALSQVNTMEDLETYRNGGFFSMQNVNG